MKKIVYKDVQEWIERQESAPLRAVMYDIIDRMNELEDVGFMGNLVQSLGQFISVMFSKMERKALLTEDKLQNIKGNEDA
jgi:hypothetical protein